MDNEEKKKLLIRGRERFELMKRADQDNLRDAQLDMEFINIQGAQWEQTQVDERGGRPCYEFNKTRINAKRIINHIRANRPQGKIRGVEGTDKQQAEYREGLIRNIWNMSDGDSVVDYAAEFQVSAGMGAWRIRTDYVDDNIFDQDIMVEPILNPFCLFNDPAARDMLKRDAMDWIYTDRISKDQYEDSYPDIEPVDFETHEFDDDDEEWTEEDSVRIAEYWYKEPVEKEIWQLTDGKVIEAEEDEAQIIEAQSPEMIKRRRTVKTHKIMMVIMSGDAILEGPTEWAGKQFPFVKVFGEYMVIDGRIHWFGIGRFAKDAQRSYNVSRTAISETIATAPLSHYWATTTQAQGNIDKWGIAHKENFPALLYTPDPLVPGAPQRMGGPDVPVALIQEASMASQEIDDVTGIYSDDRGQDSSSQSGRAIYARQEQGQVVTFNYPDNMAKGIQRTYEILLDLMPKVYDTERELRIIGQDGEEDYIKINTFVQDETGEKVKVNDLSVGRFDVTVTVGPSYSTKRQEFVEMMGQMFGQNSELMTVYGDIFYKAMDMPFSDQLAERARALLPPQIQAMLNEEAELPPQVTAAMAQVEQAMAQVQEQKQMVEQAAQEIQNEQNLTEKAKSEIQSLLAKLDKEEAQFEAKVAKEMARLIEKEAKITIEGYDTERASEIEEVKIQAHVELAQQMKEAIDAIKSMSSEFNTEAIAAIAAMLEKSNKPIIRKITQKRVNGSLEAIPEYE